MPEFNGHVAYYCVFAIVAVVAYYVRRSRTRDFQPSQQVRDILDQQVPWQPRIKPVGGTRRWKGSARRIDPWGVARAPRLRAQ